MKKKDLLVILDSFKYIQKEKELKKSLSDICNPVFYYTDYENRVIKFFLGKPFIGNIITHLLYWFISFNAAWKLFFFRKTIKTKIFINPIVAIFYCFLSSIFSKRKECIVIGGFLFEDKKNKLYFKLRKKFVVLSYKNIYKIVVYSENEKMLYSEYFPSLAEKFVFIKYGRDFDILEEKKFNYNFPYIASGGASNRDYPTLIHALDLLEKKHPQLNCLIATRPKAYDSDKKTPNATILYDIELEMFGSFLKESMFVILPLKNTLVSAGHMSLLEAMSLGKIIIIADIPSIRNYVDEELVYFYKPNDPIDLAKKIEYLYINKDRDLVIQRSLNSKKIYEENYSFVAFLNRMIRDVVI